jgi:hypothetical protein
MGEPPVAVAAPIVIVADVALAAEALTVAGAPGTVAGVTAADCGDEADDPTALLATTAYVYAVPLVRPVIRHEVAGGVAEQVPTTVMPSGA